ncbi:MAG: hypothetical protein V1647_06935 [Pseudomonadota bacterium]
MRTIIKIGILFLLITGASTILMNFFDIEYGNINFWDVHGILFLVFITLFPRLTLLFSSVAFGGIFWWLGFIFVPRFLVAILATISYWNTNKVLVIIAWLFAIGGESSEKYFIHRRTFKRHSNVIDAEYHEITDQK